MEEVVVVEGEEVSGSCSFIHLYSLYLSFFDDRSRCLGVAFGSYISCYKDTYMCMCISIDN